MAKPILARIAANILGGEGRELISSAEDFDFT